MTVKEVSENAVTKFKKVTNRVCAPFISYSNLVDSLKVPTVHHWGKIVIVNTVPLGIFCCYFILYFHLF